MFSVNNLKQSAKTLILIVSAFTALKPKTKHSIKLEHNPRDTVKVGRIQRLTQKRARGPSECGITHRGCTLYNWFDRNPNEICERINTHRGSSSAKLPRPEIIIPARANNFKGLHHNRPVASRRLGIFFHKTWVPDEITR